jgi:ferric-dicitrate binding protein FerR (iron transport regulator)
VHRFITLLFVLALSAPASAADPVGFFASLEGEVQVATPLAPGAYSWQAARRDGGVQIGDRVKTGQGAAAKIVLVDDTLLHVDEDTELEIETFHVGAAATKERSIVRHTRGRLRTLVGDAFGGETRIEIHTPTAVVGVKGTDFETSEVSLPGKERWRMCLHSGAISVSNGMGGASPRPGHCVFAELGRPPSKEFPNPDVPFEAPDSQPPADGDFSEPVSLDPPPGPGNDDPQDGDDLQIFELPDAGSRGVVITPGFSVGLP